MAGYTGQVAVIPLGVGGLLSDAPDTQIPPTNLVRANNCTFYNNVLEKDFGSEQWNATALPAGIKSFTEYYPDPDQLNQRVLCLAKDGNIYKFNFSYQWVLCAPQTGAPAMINANTYAQWVLGGNEQQNNPKKAFLFNGISPVQVIPGDLPQRNTISKPAADWTGSNQPVCGTIHQGRLFAFGPNSNPHAGYASSPTDHEDFQTLPLLFSVFPGDGQRIVCCFEAFGSLYVMKYPTGLYQLIDTDSDPLKWYFIKARSSFGAVSPQGYVQVGQDVLVRTPSGSILSIQNALVTGDLNTSDVFHQLKVYNFMNQEVRKDAYTDCYMMYYPAKGSVFVTYQSNANYYNDRICTLNMKDQSQGAAPKISWSNKDQPNCMAPIKDQQKVDRPFYGANDGFLYQMDRQDRVVGNQLSNPKGYLFDALTPDMDFSAGDALIAQKDKQFDQLQIEYQPTGDWDVSLDIFIDGRFSKTHHIRLSGYCDLDTTMKLDVTRIDGGTSFQANVPIASMGKKISVRLYNRGTGQNVRLVTMRIFYSLLGDNNTKIKGT